MRYVLGEISYTDVAQALSSLAGGRTQLALAESNFITSRATYQQGSERSRHGDLRPALPLIATSHGRSRAP